MNRANRHARAQGFTLIELLVAIAILALVAVLSWRGLDQILRARGEGSSKPVADCAPFRCLRPSAARTVDSLLPPRSAHDSRRIAVAGVARCAAQRPASPTKDSAAGNSIHPRSVTGIEIQARCAGMRRALTRIALVGE